MESLRTERTAFEWRVATLHWRWLLLGSLAAGACLDEPEQGSAFPPKPLSPAALAALHACLDPVPISGGWEHCANGVTHRAQLGECASSLPRPPGSDPALVEVLRRLPDTDAGVLADGGVVPQIELVQCRSDADCTAQPHGHCEATDGIFGPPYAVCDYGCVTDSECSGGHVCLCGAGPVGRCVASPCRTDADCEGGMCASSAQGACGPSPLACQTAQDRCASASDCAAGGGCMAEQFDLSLSLGAWHCVEQACPVIGRPFLCDGQARLAAAKQRTDWCAALPAADALDVVADETLRAAVADGWLQQALMEHASVAAFARFSLQLLSLGAPAELVSAAAQAQADEIAHAQDCFALARRSGAGDVGPGPLPLAGALDETELSSIVLGTILEGCVGETVAALEAAEACAQCADPTARAVLERIARDETRHAQLAWRVVAWALETGPASLRGEVGEAFARELATAPSAQAGSELDLRLLQHGLMSAALRSQLRARVLHEVIAPCADALLSSAAPSNAQRPAPATAALV